MDNIKRNPEYRNYAKIGAAIEFIEQRLALYTEQKVRETHQHIYKKMAGHPTCTQNCSITFSHQKQSWCISCNGWRRHLTNYYRSSASIAWENVNSGDWPKNPFNIIDVFVPTSYRNRQNYQDLSTACHIWSNMNSCKISPSLLQRVRKERNSFAHNFTRSSTLIDLSKAFDTFRDLLKDSDVAQLIDTRDSLNGLADIKAGVCEDKQLRNIEQEVRVTNAEMNYHGIKLEQCFQTIQNIDRKLDQDITQQHVRFHTTRTQNYERNKFAISIWCSRGLNNVTDRYKFSSAVILLMVLFVFTSVKDKQHQKQGCVSEQFHIPVQQDLPLLPYLNDHSKVIGREWLFSDLYKSLISNPNEKNRNGVILIAEMGYGKSAFVSELICPRSTQDTVKSIRTHIVGFHVCKFDVQATHGIGRFILRFTGFLVLKSAELGNIINMMSENSLLFDKEGCNKEPIACFDQAVLHPLKQLKDIHNKPWIFIIDALDECAMSVKSDILQLLISRIKILPKWIKVIITSRNETYLSSFRQMELRYLDPNDERNKNDLKTFIDMKLPASPTKSRTIDDLIDKSDGNFVYVVQAVTWLLSFPNTSVIPELPSDIAHIYEINFDRQFKTAEAYIIPKMILEIICSTINPIGKDDIYNILILNNITINRTEFNYHFHRLSFFLNIHIGVRVKHQTLYAWLTYENNTFYQIHSNRGHSYISNYLLGNVNANKHIDIIDLAIHVGMSNDMQLHKIFLSLKMIDQKLITKEKALHKIIWQTTSVKPLELILSQLEFVDGFNEGNVTAAFVAAAKGNLEQLKLLQRKGADMNFQTYSDFVVSEGNISDTLDRMKHVYYSGYTLLHVACQHGHLNVVEYLLRYNHYLLYVKNSLGMHAGHIACERGHLKIIKMMYTFNATIFDYDCLYYSSENNHIDVVKWLVSIGVKYKCISDFMSLHAMHAITSVRKRTLKLPEVLSNLHADSLLINPLDRWWVVYKTDPLLGSIQSGSLATARFIIKTFPNSKTCSDAFGFTPALASVVYNRTELFPVLLDHILKDTCHKTPFHIAGSTVPYVQQMLIDNNCPENGNLAHVLALYSSIHSLSFFIKNHFYDIQWNKPDMHKICPLHYAVSNKNLYFVFFYTKHFKDVNDLRTQNGSSAYHIASICGFPSILNMLIESHKSVPHIKDKNDQGILHHIVQRPLDAVIAVSDKENSLLSLYMFHKVVNESNYDLMAIDKFRRNILHYALLFGHFDILYYTIHAHYSEFKQMLRQKDINGYQPLEVAIKSFNVLDSTIASKSNCSYVDYFLRHCTSTIHQTDQFLSPVEMALTYVISNMTQAEFEHMLVPHLSVVWHKSAHLMTAIMSFHKFRNISTLRKLIVDSHHTPFTKYNQLLVLHNYPSVFIVCDQALEMSPLHYTMLKFDLDNTILSFHKDDQYQILKMLLDKSRTVERLSCKDNNGLNIFHYALLGRKIDYARLFMEHEMTIVDNKLSLKDILLMALQSRLTGTICPNELRENIDDLLVDIITLHNNRLVLNDICTNSTVDLSLIHLLAQNGMLKTIQLLVHKFSSSILYCRNVDGFTPMYLAKLFGHDDLLHHFKKMSKLVYPDHSVEQFLLVFLMDGFPKPNSVNPFACSSSSFAHIRRRKWYSCIKALVKPLHLIQQMSFLLNKVIVSRFVDVIEDEQFRQELLLHYIMKASSQVPDEILTSFDLLDIYSSMKNLYTKDIKTRLTIVLKNALSFLERRNVQEYLESNSVELFRLTYVGMRKVIPTMRDFLQNAAIQYYLQGKLSLARTMSDNYSFLAERFQHHGFNISRHYTDPVVLFDQKIINNFHHFQYLNVFKSTLSYKLLRNDINVDDRYTNVNEKYIFDYLGKLSAEQEMNDKPKVTLDILKEPFVDLKRNK